MKRTTESHHDTKEDRERPRKRNAGRIFAAVAIAAVLAGSVAWAVTRPERDVTTNSDEAYDHYKKGIVALQSHYLPEAAQEWRQAVDLDSTFAMAWMRLGRLAHSFGDRAEAERGLRMAEAQMSRLREKERLYIKLLAADMTRNDAEKMAILAELLEKYPDDVEMLFIAGNRAFHKGNFQEALSSFQKITRQDPSVGQAYNMMGYTLAEMGRFAEATEALQKYTFLTPGQPNPHDSLGELYLRTGRYEAAIAEFDRARALKSDFGWAYFHKASVLSTLGRNEEALLELAAAAENAPELPDSKYWSRYAIHLESKAGRPDRALQLVRDYEAAHPEDPYTPFIRGIVQAKSGEVAAAREELKALQVVIDKAKSGSLKPAFLEKAEPMYYELAGNISAADGDWNGAIDAFTKCLEKAEMWMMQRSIHVELMHCMIESGQAPAALETGRGLLEIAPTDPEVNFWCGRALEQMGRSDEALPFFRQAAEVLAGADEGNSMLAEARARLPRS